MLIFLPSPIENIFRDLISKGYPANLIRFKREEYLVYQPPIPISDVLINEETNSAEIQVRRFWAPNFAPILFREPPIIPNVDFCTRINPPSSPLFDNDARVSNASPSKTGLKAQFCSKEITSRIVPCF